MRSVKRKAARSWFLVIVQRFPGSLLMTKSPLSKGVNLASGCGCLQRQLQLQACEINEGDRVPVALLGPV